jgi:uncharacterized DUF497 family protein
MFDWDEFNIAHIARHNVVPAEAEQAVANRPLELPQDVREGEIRYRLLGPTDDGRILVIVITLRGKLIRVVTAHDADRRLRAYYVSIRR